MNITFGVAVKYHFSGANAEDLLPNRFTTYDDANQYANKYRDECEPSIFVILDEKYAFDCVRSAVENIPSRIYYVKNFEDGQIEFNIWWQDFLKAPYNYLPLGVKII